MNTLNPPEDVELAELLIKLHPWANNVRYARTGGETMSVAIRLARAYTRRDKYYSVDTMDVTLVSFSNLKSSKALNQHLLKGLAPLGVPKGLRGNVIPFKFNSFDELKQL